MRIKVIIIFLAFATMQGGFAKDYVDSLESTTYSFDENKEYSKLFELSEKYLHSNPSKALDYAKKALAVAKKEKDNKKIAKALIKTGKVYYFTGEYEKAKEYYEKSLELSKEINYTEGIAGATNNIGLIYEALGDTDKALKNFNTSLQLKLYKTENELQKLKNKSQRYFIYATASILLFILLITGFLYYRSLIKKKVRKKLKLKNEKITEQKILLEKAVSELRESEEKQNSLVTNILDGVFVVQNQKFIFINEAITKLTGYTFNELREKTFDDIIHPDDVEFVKQNNKARLEGKEVPKSYSIRIITKDGNIIDVLISVGLINYHGHKAVLGTLKDITSQKKYEAALIREKEQAEKETKSKSLLLAGISHEIKNHLSSIIGITNELKETELSEQQREYINVIDISGNNLMNIINEILDFTIIEAGQVVLEESEFSISNVIREVIKLHELKARQSNLYLKADIAGDVPEKVLGDAFRLSQIIVNLVNNALKFTDKGGVTLKVTLVNKFRKDNDLFANVKFQVIDTGIGISPENKETLFKPFSQTDAAIKRKKGGTGLGLVISKRLVEMMNGNIGFNSAVGKGSTFWFTARFRFFEDHSKKIDRSGPSNGKKLNILLVEDNILNQRLTTSILSKGGYSVDVAENGRKGLSLYMKKEYNVVLMDIQMPVMDGIEATRRIRKFENSSEGNGRKALIIAVTAYAKEGEKQKIFDAGMDHYLRKPFKASELLDLIKKYEQN